MGGDFAPLLGVPEYRARYGAVSVVMRRLRHELLPLAPPPPSQHLVAGRANRRRRAPDPVALDPILLAGLPCPRPPPEDPRPQSDGTALMTTATRITMIVVMAFVWGGLAPTLRTAVRRESGKGGDS